MAVILPSTYTDGTAVCTNGSPNVVGTGTMWLNTILPGDFFWTPSGESVRILTIVDDTHITLAYNWPGATQATGPYEIRFQADQGRVQETTRQLLERMQSGNLYAFAGLTGMTDTVPYFTGPGAMGVLTRQDLTNGVAYDALVNTLAERATYDNQVTGFTVLVADVGDGRAAIYAKESVSPGDWSIPAYITGPRGLTWRGAWSSAANYVADDAVSYNGASFIALVGNTNVTPVAGATWGSLATRGATGLTGVNPRGTYSGATAYAISDAVLYNGSTFVAIQATTGNAPPTLPTTSNTWWQLLAVKGTDGTGTGDVVGPAGAIDGAAAVFDGTTGKLIRAATPAQFRTWLGEVIGRNDALFALEIADLKGQRLGMVGGAADSFDDTTGIYNSGSADNEAITLLHFNGANNALDFIDNGSRPRGWYSNGGAKISTTQSKFGGASMFLDGVDDYLITVDTLSDFNFGTGDYTVEFWFRPTALPGSGNTFAFYESRISTGTAPNNPILYCGSDGKMQYFVGGAVRITATTAMVAGNWIHYALSRVSGVSRLFVNGVQEGISYTDTVNIITPPASVWIGCDQSTTSLVSGYFDEYRISRTGRYAANFTPQAAEFSTGTDTTFSAVYGDVADVYLPFAPVGTTSGPTTTTTAASVYTFVNRQNLLIRGGLVTKLGLYSAAPRTHVVKIVRRVSATVYDVVFSASFAHPGGGWFDYVLPTPFLIPFTNSVSGVAYYMAAVMPNSGVVDVTPTNIPRAYVLGDQAVANGITGWTEDSNSTMPLRVEYQPTNMTLISVAYTAASVPSTIRITAQFADSLTLTPGTDFTVEVSRDNGTTWTAVTMSLIIPPMSGVKMYEGSASVTGQPSGTAMKWRLKSLTNKAIIASGVVLQYS